MTPGVRKLALTTHVTSSVGWLGAVVAFLALALAGLTSDDPDVVRASYLMMQLTGWSVIVPLCLASLPSGLVMSLGTEWGLFRHYWVVAKLFITGFATVLLLLHMQPVGHLARVVAETTLVQGEMAGLRLRLVADAGAAAVALLTATALSIYKPRGMTPFGRRGQQRQTGAASLSTRGTLDMRNWPTMLRTLAIILAVLFVILHLTGGGLGHH